MDSDGSRIWFGIFAILIFMALKGFFTACETAAVEINDTKVKTLAEKDKSYKRLAKLLAKPQRLLTAFSVHKVLSSVIIATISVFTFQASIVNVFIKIFYPLTYDDIPLSLVDAKLVFLFSIISIFIIIIVVTILMAVFCDRLPKKLLEKGGDDFAVKTAWALTALCVLLTPLSAATAFLSKIFGKLFGLSDKSGKDSVTEEEILMMVDAGNETGVIEESQRTMINNIFEFNDLSVSEIMTHRTDLVAADINMKIAQLVAVSISSGRSRIPVYDGDIDSIIGIVYIKDLMCLVGCENTESFSIRDFLRDAIYVPESSSCADLFTQFTTNKIQFAIVVDEYGGTAGIASMEDILEAIVGNMQDEYDDEDEELTKISSGVYTVDGKASAETIMEELGCELPEDNGYDTMGGLIIDLLGRIPDENENPTVSYKNIDFTVLVTDDKMISRIKAVIREEC
ncbi:MAG: hemolysin family protein [Oscillospiraceae bacterium]